MAAMMFNSIEVRIMKRDEDDVLLTSLSQLQGAIALIAGLRQDLHDFAGICAF